MTCSEALTYLSPYLDSELDPTTSFEIARHLEQCPACAERFARERRVERRLSDAVRQAGVDATLWSKALARAPAPGRPSPLRLLAVAAATLLIVGLGLTFLAPRAPPAPPDLARVLVADHLRLVGGVERVELASADRGAIAEFFKGHLPVDVRCPPTVTPVGARNCRLNDRLVGYVQGTVSGSTVSLFFIPASVLEDFPEMTAVLRTRGAACAVPVGVYGVAARMRDRALICAVGALPPDQLLPLVE